MSCVGGDTRWRSERLHWKGVPRRRGAGDENLGELLCHVAHVGFMKHGISFWLSGQSLWLRVLLWCRQCSGDGFRQGLWEMVGDGCLLLTPSCLPVGGRLSVLCSLPGPPIKGIPCKSLLWCPQVGSSVSVFPLDSSPSGHPQPALLTLATNQKFSRTLPFGFDYLQE